MRGRHKSAPATELRVVDYARLALRAGVRYHTEFREWLYDNGLGNRWHPTTTYTRFYAARRDMKGDTRRYTKGVRLAISRLYDSGRGITSPRDIWLTLAEEGIYTERNYVSVVRAELAADLNIYQPRQTYLLSTAPGDGYSYG